MKINKVLLFIAIALVAVSACKKYPDGPFFNFQSKEKRIEGVWETEYFSVEGNDSTASLKVNPAYGLFVFDSKDKTENYTRFSYISNTEVPSGNITKPYYATHGYWMFLNSKKDLYIHQVSNTPNISFNAGAYAASDVIWEIRRLTDSELWLKAIYNNKECFMKLKLNREQL